MSTPDDAVKPTPWKNVRVVVIFATIYAGFYQVAPHLGVPTQAVIAMFLLSPFVVLYMAYVILKYGKPSRFTFEERFYDDVDSFRVGHERHRKK
jgi:hypothetical protein